MTSFFFMIMPVFKSLAPKCDEDEKEIRLGHTEYNITHVNKISPILCKCMFLRVLLT